jgi:hypothetical protein
MQLLSVLLPSLRFSFDSDTFQNSFVPLKITTTHEFDSSPPINVILTNLAFPGTRNVHAKLRFDFSWLLKYRECFLMFH